MKNKKHRFKHPDPEKNIISDNDSETKKAKVRLNKNQEESKELTEAKRDLKKSVITIIIFLFILISFYFLDQRYNFFEILKELI